MDIVKHIVSTGPRQLGGVLSLELEVTWHHIGHGWRHVSWRRDTIGSPKSGARADIQDHLGTVTERRVVEFSVSDHHSHHVMCGVLGCVLSLIVGLPENSVSAA
jgi:hypothetical protein